MLSGRSYRAAWQACPHPDHGRSLGLTPHELAALLTHLSGRPWQAWDVACEHQLWEWSPARRSLALAVVNPDDPSDPGHWVCLIGDVVFDSSLEAPLDLVDYHGHSWPVSWVVARRHA
jgi:hypothetical protein